MPAGGRWILPYVGSFFAFVAHFFDFFSLSYFALTFYRLSFDFGGVSGGFWEAKTVSKLRFLVFLGVLPSRSQF